MNSKFESGQIIQQQYQLQTLLAKNASRQTWLAKNQTNSEQLVVVKLLAFGGEVSWSELKLFEREAAILSQLDHPCIPKYIDYFTIDDRSLWFGFVQEYIAGKSLKQHLDNSKKFSLDRIKAIAESILHILIYLHQLHPPVLHRDIKPSNIILGEDRQIYLVDFGAVQEQASTEGISFTVVGTYGYTPIEQFGGRAVPASDLYALGSTLIHLLTGVSPADLPTDNLELRFETYCHQDTTQQKHFTAWLKQMTQPAVERRFCSATIALEQLVNQASLLSTNTQFIPVIDKFISRRIQIKQSPKELEINIAPSIKFEQCLFHAIGVSFLIYICVILSLAANIVGISFSLLFLNIYFNYLKGRFGKLQLLFNQNSFKITRKFFKFEDRQIGIKQNIQDVSAIYQDRSNHYEATGIIINSRSVLNQKNVKHSLYLDSRETETLQIIKIIRAWLAAQ